MSFATFALLASAIIGVESPDGSYARNYAFPITGNGSLVLGVDPEGDQMQTLPLPRMHVPEIVWEGRRYARAVNRAALLSMGHWNTRISVDGVAVGKPLSWKQSLDRSCALVTCEATYSNATVRTEVFTLADLNLVGVRKRVKGARGAKRAEGTGAFAEPWEILELRSHPWFVSAGGNYMNTLTSLLVGQSEASPEVRLAWGVPPELKDYAFRLPLYGNGWVELAVKDGRVVKFDHDAAVSRRFTLPPGLAPASAESVVRTRAD